MEYVRAFYILIIHGYAEIISAFLGIGGAIAFAKAPIESIKSRRALFQILALDHTIDRGAASSARTKLVEEAEVLLEKEEKWNYVGAILLALSFLFLFVHALDMNLILEK